MSTLRLQHDTSRRMSYSANTAPQQDYAEEQLEEYQQDDADMDDSHLYAEGAREEQKEAEQMVQAPTVAAPVAAAIDPTVPPSVSDVEPGTLDAEALLARTEAILGVDWDLQQEIFRDMLKNERKYRIYNPEAKYQKHRRIIVDWMCEVGEEYKLCALTIHNAVRYLDRVLGAQDVQKNKLQLVAMACVLVASKCEEAEDVTPTLNELNECSNHAYTGEEVKIMEVAVLRALGWSLTVVNPIHFLQFFQARGIVFQNDLFEGGAQNRRSALKYVRKYADFFAELCLQEYPFQMFTPSIMAAAVVAAARRAVKIDPIWNQELEGLTTYDELAIYDAYNQLWKYYVTSFPAAPQCVPSPTSVLQFEERAALRQQQLHIQQQQQHKLTATVV